jgi:hypothetical protein
MFWVDLSSANGLNVNLIEGSFTGASATTIPASGYRGNTTPSINDILPAAKLGQDNYIYVWSQNGVNYFGLSGGAGIGNSTGWLDSVANLTVSQAYAIDQKIDDGFPQTGNVTAQFLNGGVQWAPYPTGLRPYQTGAGSSATCYDDNNSAGSQMHYSMQISNGAGVNCALSFQFQ